MQEYPVVNPLRPRRLDALIALAHLLDRLEKQPLKASPDQYRLLVQRIQDELLIVRFDPQLEAVLTAFPGAAEIYENLSYEWAGLCRSPLEFSARTELLTRQVLHDAARRADA